MQTFSWSIRVYYEDTDAGGVVYHSKYMNFFERARTEWLRSRGFDQSALVEAYSVVFAVRRMTIEFIKPARLDDQLTVTVEPGRIGGARLQLRQTLERNSNAPQRQQLAAADVEVACLDARQFAPVRIPAAIKEKL